METPGAGNRQECLFLAEHSSAPISEHINLSLWEGQIKVCYDISSKGHSVTLQLKD